MRVLFCDDEPRILEALENLLFDAPDDWEFEFAVGGECAIRHLGESFFDVLVTDMCMPTVDGLAVLAAAQDLAPGTVRVVLSGHTTEDAAREAMARVHEFLSKPCKPDELMRVLSRCDELRRNASEQALAKAVGNVGALPSRPETHARVVAMLDKGDGLDDVATVIAGEMAIATKLLHVANTSFYARGRAVSSVQEAVRRLGSKTVLALVLAVETYERFEVPIWLNLENMHAHSQEVGMLAAQLVPRELQPAALLAGLLHDVGVLLMAAYFPEQAERAHSEGLANSHLEHASLGFGHGALGGHLLRLWNIGDDIALAVEQHHHPFAERSELGRAIFAADRAVHNETDDSDLSDEDQAVIARAREVLLAGAV
ncbi:MAG: HDOD domain-containing protein [Polyangiales bacterium]